MPRKSFNLSSVALSSVSCNHYACYYTLAVSITCCAWSPSQQSYTHRSHYGRERCSDQPKTGAAAIDRHGEVQLDRRTQPASNWITGSPIPSLYGYPLSGVETSNSSASEDEEPPIIANKRRSSNAILRRRRYRLKTKAERAELRQLEAELSKQVRELIEMRNKITTTARTDLLVSKSFWKDVARRQRARHLQAEAERKRLTTIVNSQSSYIENLGVALREHPSVLPGAVALVNHTGYDRMDDRKWLRLKSSDAALYEAYLDEVNAGYQHNPNGEVEYIQYVDKLLRPFSFEDICSSLWKTSKLPHRNIDRQVYEDVTYSRHTIGFKFRLKKTLPSGLTVSILKRVVSRRFREGDRDIFVWKIFAEGEGVFSSLDVDETAWTRIRSYSDGANSGTLWRPAHDRFLCST